MTLDEIYAIPADEINIDMPMSEKGARHEMTVLRDCMQSIEVAIPLLSDGEVGTSWGRGVPAMKR